MKKITIFINSLGGGGAEKVLLNFLSVVDSSEFSVTLVTAIGGVYEDKIPNHVRYKKIIKSKSKIITRLLLKILNHLPSKIFRRLFLNDDADLKIAYTEGLPTKVLWSEDKCKIVAFVHCDISVNNLIAPYYSNKKQCLKEYQQFDKVCFVSENAQEGFFKTIGTLDNACVIHNIVDVENIKAQSNAANILDYETKGTRFITVGRLSKEKGYVRLLNVLSKLDKIYDFELWILGEGPERHLLETIINQNGLRSVRLLGFTENPYSYMKKADMFICSSYFEGYSTAVNESLILGIPVLTTACAGMDEITEHGKYGIIVDNDDDCLLKGINNILCNPEKIDVLKYKLGARRPRTNIEEYNNLFGELFDQ